MKTFTIYAERTTDLHAQIEANTLEEAIAKAQDLAPNDWQVSASNNALGGIDQIKILEEYTNERHEEVEDIGEFIHQQDSANPDAKGTAIYPPAVEAEKVKPIKCLGDLVDATEYLLNEDIVNIELQTAHMYAKECLHRNGLPRECHVCGCINNNPSDVIACYADAYDDEPFAIRTYCAETEGKSECNDAYNADFQVCQECERHIDTDKPENFPEPNGVCARCLEAR